MPDYQGSAGLRNMLAAMRQDMSTRKVCRNGHEIVRATAYDANGSTLAWVESDGLFWLDESITQAPMPITWDDECDAGEHFRSSIMIAPSGRLKVTKQDGEAKTTKWRIRDFIGRLFSRRTGN